MAESGMSPDSIPKDWLHVPETHRLTLLLYVRLVRMSRSEGTPINAIRKWKEIMLQILFLLTYLGIYGYLYYFFAIYESIEVKCLVPMNGTLIVLPTM